MPVRYYEYSPLRADSSDDSLNNASGSGDHSSPHNSGAFRILRIHPGKPANDIVCSLHTCRLLDFQDSKRQRPPAYDALSYHWGPQSLDGSSHEVGILEGAEIYQMQIGANLHAALKEFRDEADIKCLWVDALCIDQSNKEEKSVQIPLMRIIYNQAECVRVWLGPEADDSDMAMDFVSECLNLKKLDTLVTDTRASPKWAALSALMRRPWFNRRWIIQEVALARKAIIHCGHNTVQWREFAAVVMMLQENREKLRQLFRESPAFKNLPDYLGDLSELGAIRLADVTDNLFRKTTDGQITGKLFTLEALMSALTAFEASEPRDVLYAVLWLADDATPVKKSPFSLATLAPPVTDAEVTRSPVQLSFPQIPSPQPSQTDGEELQDPDIQQWPDQTTLHPSSSTKRKRSHSDMLNQSTTSRDLGSHQRPTLQVNVTDFGARTVVTGGLTSTGVPDTDLSLSARSVASNHSRRGSINSSSSTRYRPNSIATSKGQDKLRAAAKLFVQRLEPKRIVVDYEKSVFEVCRDLLQHSFKQSKAIDMICLPWAPRLDEKVLQEEGPLPSWIPSLTGTAFSPDLDGTHHRINADSLVKRLGYQATGMRPYAAAVGPVEPETHWSFGGQNDRSLFVTGFVLDKIRHRLPVASEGAIPSEWMTESGWVNDNERPPDRFWRTLVGNRDSDGKFAPIHWEHSCHYAFKQRPKDGKLNTKDLLLKCPTAVRGFLERVLSMIWGRRLVLLERLGEQSLAIVPEGSKKEDLICILYGCSVPVVLRELVDNEPVAKRRKTSNAEKPKSLHYQLIGECYLHNFMNGEAFRVKGNHNDKKTFELR